MAGNEQAGRRTGRPAARQAGSGCVLRGCKNRPAPFPGRMSYEATKPGSVRHSLACFIFCCCLLGPRFITGRVPRSGKLPVIYSQAKNQHFRPMRATRCTDSCEIWHYQGTHGSAWPHEISRQSVHGVGMGPPKYQKFPLFGNESPRRDEPLDRFLKILWPNYCFKFDVIRFTGVIARRSFR